VELKPLTGRRGDLVNDRTHVINRLRELLTGIFRALERALDVTNTGPLVLLTVWVPLIWLPHCDL
jgi:hypothetical protein